MIKCTLRIEGSAEEIEKCKGQYTFYGLKAAKFYKTITEHVEVKFEKEYVTREPKCRYKTLVELVSEYGENITIEEHSAVTTIGYGIYEMHAKLLGKDWGGSGSYSQAWKKIFLKEIT